MTMRQFIERLKERPETAEPPGESQREWLEALSQLYLVIEQWLEPAERQKLLRLSRSEVPVQEPDLGAYLAPVLEIGRGGVTARLVPVGARVAGVVASGGVRHLGLRGRVDLVFGPIRVPLVRKGEQREWWALPERGSPAKLDADTFAEILGEVLLDE